MNPTVVAFPFMRLVRETAVSWYNSLMKIIKMARRGQLKNLDRSFDLIYWQRQSSRAKFDATWELILHAYRVKGHNVRQLRLQRSVESFQKQQR